MTGRISPNLRLFCSMNEETAAFISSTLPGCSILARVSAKDGMRSLGRIFIFLADHFSIIFFDGKEKVLRPLSVESL